MSASGFQRERGTSWRIWDLHVHTPASIEQHYGGDNDATWERYLEELEALPADVSVIGINDYWFLDGYKRVVAARNDGRLQNLDAIFPVIEMRLDQFGGTAGDLSRVNLHVIFDPALDAELIQAQFINALQPRIKLDPGCDALGWQGVITRESLSDLGAKIKSSVPADQLPHYGSDFREGFNNLNVSLSDVQSILQGQYFQGRALVGIGKTEWRSIRWNEQSIANKKNVINSADFVFTAYQDVSRWESDVEGLRVDGVTHKVLDCSDAHYFSDSDQHMRLGACQTWMNTTPTLAGLSYAIEEFDRRVFVGLEPPTLARIRRNPERFIDRVSVASDGVGHDLFQHDLPLNPGFIAVVGNKGQGKSALLDCIALGGNSSRNSEFAFLRSSRFLSPTNIKVARNYRIELRWATGATRSATLDSEFDKGVPVSVEYLPQMFVERVCNLDPDADDSDEFETELRTILFTHISEEQRAGAKSFDALLSQKTMTSHDDIRRCREALRLKVQEYVELSGFRANNRAEEVQRRLKLKQDEVVAAERSLVDAQTSLAEIDAESKEDGDLGALMASAAEIEANRASLIERRSAAEVKAARIRQGLATMDALRHRAEAIRGDAVELSREADEVMGASGGPFATITIDTARYGSWKSNEESELERFRIEQENLTTELAAAEEARRLNAEALAAADSARERARQRVLQSEERLAALKGDASDEESLLGLSSLLSRIAAAPKRLAELRTEVLEHAGHVHRALEAQLEVVESLYAPATEFIRGSEVVRNAGLEFNAELRILPAWRSVPSGLDGRRNGDFSDWLVDLPQRLEDTGWDQIGPQLGSAFDRLERERGEAGSDPRDPATALRSTTTLEDFLMGMFDLAWLEVRFGLTGDGLPLSQLSPGQRGLVLALFYLVVDRRTTPLLLDQPEENLDNETIASKLVPAIHEAAGRRQTIVVTHNANLAIVGDADQIVHCQMTDRRFEVSSGSIAELEVAQFSLDVLEGTKPAFDNRRHKYEAFPELV